MVGDRPVLGTPAARAPAAARDSERERGVERRPIDAGLAAGNDAAGNVHARRNHFAFGRNALTTASLVVRYGPSIRSTQYGTAGNTASRQSRMALGLPGRLTISDRPRTPAICRDRIAVGTTL